MGAPRLVPAPAPAPLPALDAPQRRALEAASAPGPHLRVVGEPGSGKTTLAVALIADAVRSGRVDADRALLITPSRASAARLRDSVSAALGVATGAPSVRSASSAAFAVLSAAASRAGEPAPRLISGADQDAILRDLLASHARGLVPGPDWDGIVPADATGLPGFRAELRDLVMRAAGAAVEPDELAELGAAHGRPEWRAAADVYREYLRVTRLGESPADQGARYDPAAIVAQAARALADWPAPGLAPTWDLVVVDDAQDATVGAWAMWERMADGGARVVLLGNTDESVEGYRGGAPGRFAAAVEPPGRGGMGAAHLALGPSHRASGPLRAVTLEVARRIGGGPREDRPLVSATETAGAPVVAAVATLASERARAIAAAVRRARLESDGALGWADFAVIARSAAQLRATRADLLALGVPCEGGREAVALHREPAVVPLMLILRAAGGGRLDYDEAVALLTCRAVGLDTVAVRKLRRALLREERDGGGERNSTELVLDAIHRPDGFASVGIPDARRAAVVTRAIASAAQSLETGGTAAMALWAAWTALGVADAWRASALSGSAVDDADLDAVIALMRSAEQHALRHDGARASDFVAYLEAQDLVADTLSARAARRDAISLETPASAAGREWHTVFVIGLEDGAWPNPRLRDSVLGAHHLSGVLAGTEPGAGEDAPATERYARARAAVAADEARAFYVALTRARSAVRLVALRGAEERPSRFADWARPADAADADWLAPLRAQERVADLREAVVRLRAEALAQPAGDREVHVAALAQLADAAVAGASPHEWPGARERSSADSPLPESLPVAVSPSKVGTVETCPLRWALTAAGGEPPSDLSQSVGTLVHSIAEQHPRGSASELRAALDARWGELDLGDGWVAAVQREHAHRMVDKLAAYFAATGADADVRVEVDVRAEIGRAVLTATVDRLHVYRDGTLRVADIKTGKNAETKAEAAQNAQLAMYQLGVAAAGIAEPEQVLGAELVFVGTSAGSAAVREQASLVELESATDGDVAPPSERLELAVEAMSGPTYAACAGEHCRTCPVRRACPAQPEGRGVGE